MMYVFTDAGYEVSHHFEDGVIAVDCAFCATVFPLLQPGQARHDPEALAQAPDEAERDPADDQHQQQGAGYAHTAV